MGDVSTSAFRIYVYIRSGVEDQAKGGPILWDLNDCEWLGDILS